MKIPKNAVKTYSGVYLSVYEWNQKLMDGSYATYEGVKRCDAVQVIAVTEDKKILILRENQPFVYDAIGIAGGRSEKSETNLQAAKRELLEETGYKSNNWKLYKSYDPLGLTDFKIKLYIAKNCRKVAEQNLDSGEKISVSKVTFKDFIKKVKADNFRFVRLSLDVFRMSKGQLKEFEKILLS